MMKEQMKIYISGKISGLRRIDAYANFDEAERQFQKAGCKTINPMTTSAVITEMDWKTYMTIAYAVLHDPSVDAIYMLRNWKESRGAVIEWAWAQARGLPVMYQDPKDYKEYK